MPSEVLALKTAPEPSPDLEPKEILTRALEKHHPHIALACSFSAEDIAVLDMMLLVNPEARVFALDTGRLDPETYDVAEQVRRRLGVKIEWMFPQAPAVEELVRIGGMFSFRQSVEDRRACCGIRKVEPLKRALSGLGAWITGMRRDQAATRGAIHQVEVDESNGGIEKYNPIAAFSVEDTWRYIHERDLPYNSLYDRGYTQIGCQPCTTAVRPGEDPRAGRWRWEAPEHKECGLHTHNKGSGI